LFALTTAKAAPYTDILLVDERRTAQVNVLVLDFVSPEFDRSQRETSPVTTDPPVKAVIEIANLILSRIRVYSRAFQIKPLELGNVPWHVRYLTDNQQELDREEGKLRGVRGGSRTLGGAALTPEIIEMAANSQTEEPFAWDQLLLDSYAQLPDVGGAIVMASASLETFIGWAVNILHQKNPLPLGLWEWINKRDHWTKEPSVSEKFDALLRVFTGHSLKDESKLWQAFSELRKARNSLVHEGSVKLGGKPLEAGDALNLIFNADKIIKWVELLLPEEHRRLRTDATGPFTSRLLSSTEAAILEPNDLAAEQRESIRRLVRKRLEAAKPGDFVEYAGCEALRRLADGVKARGRKRLAQR